MSEKKNLPEKPRFGEPCNGCGYCCIEQPCKIAEEFLQCTEGPCVALEYENDRTYCGMVRRPIAYLWAVVHPDQPPLEKTGVDESEASRLLAQDIYEVLGAGKGCDSSDF